MRIAHIDTNYCVCQRYFLYLLLMSKAGVKAKKAAEALAKEKAKAPKP